MTFSLSCQIPPLKLEVIYQPGTSLQVHRKQAQAPSHALLCFTFKDVWARPGACLREYPIYICAFRCDPRNITWIIQGIHWESEKACECDDQRAAGCPSAALLCNTQLYTSLQSWMLNEQRPPRSLLGMIPSMFHWCWNAPESSRSWPVLRWWKCWFTGVII